MRATVTFLMLALSVGCPRPQVERPDAGPPRAGGEPCEDNDQCLSGVCNLRSSQCTFDECAVGCPEGLVCADFRDSKACEPPGVHGERCYLLDDVQTYLSKDCAEGLSCVISFGPFANEGRCVPPTGRRLLDPCAATEECESPLSCEFSFCRAPLGTDCESDEECGSLLCGANLVCVVRDCSPFDSCTESDAPICSGGPCGFYCAAARLVGETCEVIDETCPELFECDAGLECRDAICAPFD